MAKKKMDRATQDYLDAVEALVMAYEKADPDNGGGESVDWSDLDRAFNLAKDALKKHAPARLKSVIETVREENEE